MSEPAIDSIWSVRVFFSLVAFVGRGPSERRRFISARQKCTVRRGKHQLVARQRAATDEPCVWPLNGFIASSVAHLSPAPRRSPARFSVSQLESGGDISAFQANNETHCFSFSIVFRARKCLCVIGITCRRPTYRRRLPPFAVRALFISCKQAVFSIDLCGAAQETLQSTWITSGMSTYLAASSARFIS